MTSTILEGVIHIVLRLRLGFAIYLINLRMKEERDDEEEEKDGIDIAYHMCWCPTGPLYLSLLS